MKLNLKYEPKAANAKSFADDIVVMTKEITGIDLDYTPASLQHADNVIEGFRGEGLETQQVAETLFGFGCYVGQTMVESAAGEWIDTPDDVLELLSSPMVIRLPNGAVCNPIGKAIKRMENGEEDSLVYFYQAFTQPESEVESD